MSELALYALNPSIEDTAFLTTEEALVSVGQNTGNLAFNHAVHKQIGLSTPVFSPKHSIEEIHSQASALVIPCANQLGAHCDMGELATRFNKINRPCTAIGLGAQGAHWNEKIEIPEGTLRWYDAMAERAPGNTPNIAVRGEFTYQTLERYGRHKNAMVLGCPSNFINESVNLGEQIAANASSMPRRIAIAKGFPWNPAYQKVERTLTDIATLTKGAYIAQMSPNWFKLARGDYSDLDSNALDTMRNQIKPYLSEAEFLVWSRDHLKVFFNIPAWMEYLRQFDFVIGARIHGVMLALQTGIPAMCITADTRTEELCQTMAIPNIKIQDIQDTGLTIYDIERHFKFDPSVYDSKRRELAGNYVDFLEANNLPVANYLRKISNPVVKKTIMSHEGTHSTESMVA